MNATTMTMVFESPTVGDEIIDTNRALLRDSIDLLERLPADVYATPHLEGASSIGAHIRHVLEHYDCFLVGLQRGAIDYTARARTPEIEASTAAIRSSHGWPDRPPCPGSSRCRRRSPPWGS